MTKLSLALMRGNDNKACHHLGEWPRSKSKGAADDKENFMGGVGIDFYDRVG
jgi:hypothetical protein